MYNCAPRIKLYKGKIRLSELTSPQNDQSSQIFMGTMMHTTFLKEEKMFVGAYLTVMVHRSTAHHAIPVPFNYFASC